MNVVLSLDLATIIELAGMLFMIIVGSVLTVTYIVTTKTWTKRMIDWSSTMITEATKKSFQNINELADNFKQ